MKPHHPIVLLVQLLLLLFLQGCGGGGGHDPTPPEGPPLTVGSRTASLDATLAKVAELSQGEPTFEPQALVAFLKARPDIRNAGVSPDGSVWAVFTDGQRLVVGNNARMEPHGPFVAGTQQAKVSPLQRQEFAAASAESPGRAKAVAAGGVPVEGTAYVMNTWGSLPLYPSLVSNDWTRSRGPDGTFFENMGYESVVASSATVEDLKAVRDAAVFYLSTHGGLLGEGGQMTRALMTSTVADEQALLTHRADLDAGRLVYYIALNNYSDVTKWSGNKFLAITPAFVSHYGWTFTADSFVFLNACITDWEGWRSVFKQAGAAAFVGWDRSVWINRIMDAGHAVLGRLSGHQGAVLSDPWVRPFDVNGVKEYLDRIGVTRYDDPSEGGVVSLSIHVLNDDFETLVPALLPLEIDESRDELILRGSFGSRRGLVLVGEDTLPNADYRFGRYVEDGVELEIKSWTKDKIVCRLPRSGPGSAGQVMVLVGNRSSNVRAISQWQGTVHYSASGPGSLKQRVDFGFRLRADIGGVRERIDHFVPASPFTAVAPRDAQAVFASYSYTGTADVPEMIPDHSYFSQWSGAGSIDADSANGDAGRLLSYEVRVDKEGRRMQFMPIFLHDDGLSVVGYLQYQGRMLGGFSSEPTHHPAGIPDSAFDGLRDGLPYLEFELDEEGHIQPGSRSRQAAPPAQLNLMGTIELDVNWTWGRIEMKHPPDINAGR